MNSNLPQGWEEKELGEISQVLSSKRIFSKEYVSTGIPFYRSKEIIQKALGEHLSDILYISNERFLKIKNKFGAPQKGDLLISAVGNRSGIPYIVEDETFYFKDGNLIWFRNFKDNYSSEFLYYYLKSREGQEQLDSVMIGSAQKALTISSLQKLKVIFPKFDEQKRIADILSAFDDKIELNNQMNQTLEDMATTLFKEWFENFNFPNDEGKAYKENGGEFKASELGEIPVDWEVKKIKDVVKIIRGASPRPIQEYLSDKGIPWIKISDATSSNSKYLLKTKEFIKEDGRKKSRPVSPNTLILSNSATPGLPKIVKIDACVHDGWLIFNDYKLITKEYMFQLLLKEKENILQLSNGSVFRNLKTDILKDYKIIIPSESTIELFTEYMININKIIYNNVEQNKTLKKQRDTLLPKLMSGEIRV